MAGQHFTWRCRWRIVSRSRRQPMLIRISKAIPDDDHADLQSSLPMMGQTFRHAVSSILAELPELKLLAEAADGAEAIKMAAELNPDLVLLDVGLPIVNGVEAAAKIRTVAPNAKLLFLTQHDSPDFVRAALRAGALGYVLKVDVGSELLQAAMAVVRGEQYLSSGIRR